MKKLSLLCILAIICANLASCDDAIVINPGSTTGASEFTSAQTVEATQAPQTANHFTTSLPIAVNPVPSVEKQDIYYDSIDSTQLYELIAGPSIQTIEYILTSLWEEDGLPIAICRITVRDIDYSQITEEKKEIPVVVSIDKIIEKNSFFDEKEGATVSATNYYCGWYLKEDTVAVRFIDNIFPVAEVGEEYLVVLLKDHENTSDTYNMGGISVPLPSKDEISDEYFNHLYETIGISKHYARGFASEALDKWFYPYLDAE